MSFLFLKGTIYCFFELLSIIHFICVTASDDTAAVHFVQNPEALKQKLWFMIRRILQ